MIRSFVKALVLMLLFSGGLWLGAPFIVKSVLTSIPAHKLFGIRIHLNGVDIAGDRLAFNGVFLTKGEVPVLMARRVVVLRSDLEEIRDKGVSALVNEVRCYGVLFYPLAQGRGLLQADLAFEFRPRAHGVEVLWRLWPGADERNGAGPLSFSSVNGTLFWDGRLESTRLDFESGEIGFFQGDGPEIGVDSLMARISAAKSGEEWTIHGEVESSPIFLDERSLGAVELTIEGPLDQVVFHGAMITRDILGEDLVFEGSLRGLSHGEVISFDVKTQESLHLKSLNLATLWPGLADATLNGTLSFSMNGTVEGARGPMFHGVITFDGDVEGIQGEDAGMNGVHTAFEFYLVGSVLYPSPDQGLEIREIVWRGVSLEDVEASYGLHVYPGIGFDLNRVKARWAGGRIFLGDLLLPEKDRQVEGILFFDRVNLGEALSQLGLKRVYGDALVSGKVRFSLAHDGLRIEDGVLFSQPGKKGVIKIKEASLITGQLPGTHPLFGQLLFASEALREFEYEWVNVLLNMKDEDLVMTIQLNGTPAKPLPFRYDTSAGGFVRDERGPGIRQEMRIDVNLSVPLNDLFHLGAGVKAPSLLPRAFRSTDGTP